MERLCSHLRDLSLGFIGSPPSPVPGARGHNLKIRVQSFMRETRRNVFTQSNESSEFFTQEICSDSTTQVYLSRRLIDLWASRESRYMDSVQ